MAFTLRSAVTAFIVLSAAQVGIDAKGSNGATGGGSYRGGRSGSHSRRTYSAYAPIYFYGGTYRGAAHSRRGEVDAGVIDPNVENSVFCKREVRFDHETYDAASAPRPEVVVNSTRYCYTQATPVNGAPENKPLLSMWLDVYQWTLSAAAGGYPEVAMRQAEDKDMPQYAALSKLRLLITQVVERSPAGVLVQAFNTTDMVFKAYRKGPAGTDTWGYPASYYKDQSRVLTFSVRAQASGVDMVLTFSVVDDFAESPFVDRSFARPSAIIVDVTVSQFPFQSEDGEIGVDMVLMHNKALPSVIAKPVASRHGTEYDPRARNRVELGTLQTGDFTSRGRHYFSWAANINDRQLCLNASAMGNGCARLVSQTAVCEAGDTACASYNMDASVMSGKKLSFVGTNVTKQYAGFHFTPTYPQPPTHHSTFANSFKGANCDNFTNERSAATRYVSWSTTLGTFDPAESMALPPPSSAATTFSLQAAVAVAVCVAMAVLL